MASVPPTASTGRALTPHDDGWATVLAGVRPGFVEFALLGVSVLISLIGLVQGVDVWPPLTIIAPLFLAMAMVWGCFHAVRINRAAAWAPLLWWRLAMMAYSGVGSLLPVVASPETRNYVDSFFRTFPTDVVKYNLVSSLFALILLATVRLVLWAGTRRNRFAVGLGVERSSLSAVEFGVVAILLALPVRVFGTILPLITGNPSALPGSVSMLELLSSVGYALLVAYYLEKRSKKLWLVLALVVFDSVLGLLSFAKLSMLFPLAMASLGALYQRPTLKRLGGLTALLTGLYVIATPMVSYGRAMDWAIVGGQRPPTAERSIEILRGFTFEKAQDPGTEGIQFAWARVAYYNAGSFAISRYDQGIPGNSLENLGVVLIPRVLYPDKPIITDISTEFNFLVTGTADSASNPGIPSEGYWVAGWWGVLAFAVLMGVAFAIWSIYALRVIQMQAWHLLFVVLIGIRVGTRIDGLFVADFFPLAFAAPVMHLAFNFANRLISRRTPRRGVSSRRKQRLA